MNFSEYDLEETIDKENSILEQKVETKVEVPKTPVRGRVPKVYQDSKEVHTFSKYVRQSNSINARLGIRLSNSVK